MLVAILLSLSAAQAAAPAAHDQTCAAPAPLPAGMEGWHRPVAMRAGASAARPAALTIGTAAAATLLPTPRVAYAVRPEKPGGEGSSGGVFAFTVKQPGRYRVALGAGAWVDVLGGGTPLASAAHGHGPACSTVRKIVEFDLQPGRYLLQVAGSGTPSLPILVSRVSPQA